MFKKILVANRGEIALRIIRSCQELGVKTVAIHSTVDSDSLHVKLADESVCVGPPLPSESYLNHKAIFGAVCVTNADAIHPGYGFLSENANFARKCQKHNITFIGPSASAISLMGDKIAARNSMKKVGLHLVPGSDGNVESLEEATKVAQKIGFPILIKATAGGGGKGMKIVRDAKALKTAFITAKTEANNAFGNPDVFIEKFLENPKHIEIQILADKHGNVIHLGERDCSVQRRYQKLMEETPCVTLPDKIRKKMCKAAISAAKAVNYDSAGTIEFIYENGHFYFMEMNTRIQVEHTVTEMVYGFDLVKQQILIANGEKLHLPKKELTPRGHAIECRINAEDPHKFFPSPGTITEYHAPGGLGVRVDSAVYSSYKVLPNYDSMIAKLIVHSNSRSEAILKMKRALDEYIVEGIKTNIPFHKALLNEPEILNGTYTTNFLKQKEIQIPREED